jgi:predicted O-linked N-acetylglucosamine transferase (SPINDLY family)
MAGGNVKRLIDRFGADVCDRIDVVDAAMAEDFYAEIDVALTPAAGVSARAAAEALACGVPVLAIAGEGPYAAMMHDVGLGAFIAPTPGAYIALSARLAVVADERAKAVTAAATLTDRAQDVAFEIAAAIETGTRAMLGAAAA